MSKVNILVFVLIGLLFGCTDPDKDPFKLEQLKKGSLITLRGQAFENLFETEFRAAVDKFSRTGDVAAEAFEFDTDFLAEDVNSLDKVEIFARTRDITRKPVATVPGSDFKAIAGQIYPRASISIPLPTILSALGISATDLAVNAYIFIECDLTLKDGSKVPASAIVNSSLSESDLFYPAHNMRYLVTE